MAQKLASEPETINVVLRAPHHHANVPYIAGDTLYVTQAEAAWLAKRGIIDAFNLDELETFTGE